MEKVRFSSVVFANDTSSHAQQWHIQMFEGSKVSDYDTAYPQILSPIRLLNLYLWQQTTNLSQQAAPREPTDLPPVAGRLGHHPYLL